MKARHHYFLPAATIYYLRTDDDQKVQQRTLNAIIQSPDKGITTSVINHIRAALIDRIVKENGADPSKIVDVAFLSFSYLGFMTDQEFNDLEQEQKPKATKKH